MNQNIYATGIYIKQNPKFEGLNISIKTSEFVKFLQSNTNEKGYCNISINPRKETTEYGITHYCKLNNWEPNQPADKTINSNSTMVNDDNTSEDCGDLPF